MFDSELIALRADFLDKIDRIYVLSGFILEIVSRMEIPVPFKYGPNRRCVSARTGALWKFNFRRTFFLFSFFCLIPRPFTVAFFPFWRRISGSS